MKTAAWRWAVVVLVGCAGGDDDGGDRALPDGGVHAPSSDEGVAGRAPIEPEPGAVPGTMPGTWRYPTASWTCGCTKLLTPADAQAYRSGSLDPHLTIGATGGPYRVCVDSAESAAEAAEDKCDGSAPGTCYCRDCCPLGDMVDCLADDPGECDGRLCPDSPPVCGTAAP